MYYEEKYVNGMWHYRQTPKGNWKPMQHARLNSLITELKAKIADPQDK